jgi:hypothetical protein
MTQKFRAEQLNDGCFCITLDRGALEKLLDGEVGLEGFTKGLTESRPSLFSNVPVFVSADTMTAMAQVVRAVEAAAELPGYRSVALSWAPPIAQLEFGPLGALMGYDFHITSNGPKLIEVNTNAGGAFLNSTLARAQRACCAKVEVPIDILPPKSFGEQIANMFVAEWRRQRGSGRPTTIAIVDDNPIDQYLYPEFRLAEALLESQGFQIVIADASALTVVGNKLMAKDVVIDLVYNRLVDFAFDEPGHAALRAAYVSDRVVVTPNPRVHALLADKRNLTLLSDVPSLEAWGLIPAYRAILDAAVPKTIIVSPGNAEEVWRDRRNLFFKPARGYGSKAAYRGDKITRKVWAEIVAGDHVAQTYAAPGPRAIEHEGARTHLKVDVRLFTYAGAVQLVAARLYQGQTTNMRTPGGGFAPVLEVLSPNLADQS